MLAESRGPDPLGVVTSWRTSKAGKETRNSSSVCPSQQDHGVCQRWRDRNPQQQTSSQKSCFFGLEVKPELVWEDWDLQREFTKTLVLKNIHLKLQKLHVRPPVSKFFTVSIPQIIVISPGTSFSAPVTFSPLQRYEYEDSIEFRGKDGSFQVSLRATFPCPALEVPDSVLLPLCAVQHSSKTTFPLRNVSKLHIYFQWECVSAFFLSPEQGLLKPGQESNITVVFRPQEALVYQQHAHCRFGEKEDLVESFCTVLLQGTAKYPCLQIRTSGSKNEKGLNCPELQFESVAVGQSLKKHFEIVNPSAVNASFSLSNLLNEVPLLTSQFSCEESSGEVAPGESVWATVTYTPALVDTVSIEYISVQCRGALNETLLKVTGNCIGPKVSLSSSVVNFGCVQGGGAVVQTVDLLNSTSVKATFQWDLDCTGHSVFSIQPASGTVGPHSQITLQAVYRPTQFIAHHRRVACLILHRDPIFLDLIGTCHSEQQRPAILKPEHLVGWYGRCDLPLGQQGVLSPMEEAALKLGSAGIISVCPTEEYFKSSLGCRVPLSSSSSLSQDFTVEPSELLFNHKKLNSSTASLTSSQYVSIANHTKRKLSLVWTVAKDSPFSVSPTSCDLATLKTTSFRVTYDPKQLNTLHDAQLECFGYSKENQNLEEPLLSPPWCVTVRVIGHSFQPGKEHFIPHCSLKPNQVVFPALGVVSYRSVLLQNSGDLPLTFCFDQTLNPTLGESLLVVPSCGLIQPWNHQILTLRTAPIEDSPKQGFSLHMQLNASKHTKELTVVNVVKKLCVSLEGNGSLYFQPTAVGSRTQRSHHIRNISSLPLRFQWSILESDKELIFVEPDTGELHPNESSSQMWSFSPLEEKTYTLKPTLTFWPIQMPGPNKSQLTLKVVGMGSTGYIKAEKALLDVGDILVGSCRSIEVPLVNSSPCSVSFCLSVQQICSDEKHVDDLKTGPALKLDFERGTIASQSPMLLQSTVRPHRQAQYKWIISYQTLNSGGNVLTTPKAVCEVRAKGVFPTLQVIDVCSTGSVATLSKAHLWKLFSLDDLNKSMLCNPSPVELTHRTPVRHSMRSSLSYLTKTTLDFNFSAAPLQSEPSTLMLMFHNPSSLPVDWTFLFPEDQQIELDFWAETGDFSDKELYHMKVQDNQVFSISPRSGTLLPGQQRAVSFSYSHNFTGADQFPVVMKISHGREILLNFLGLTVEMDRAYLHFASTQHVFTSVTIGDCNPPRQMYEIHNRGAVPVHYEVDRAALLQLQVDNFNHSLLCCLNPEGEVLPGKTAVLEWIFSPLEAKKYCMDILIHIHDGDSTLVRFEGCGLHSSTVCSNKQLYSSDGRVPLPSVERLPFPGQVLFLAEDNVSLGNIPVSSKSLRTLYLTNLSHTDKVHFTWDLIQQTAHQLLQISPDRGILHPGESVLCFLSFTSSDYPTNYQLDVICQVFQEAALTQYYHALRCWEEEKERQLVEFTITDKNNPENQRVLMDEDTAAPTVKKVPPLRKYKTLPPICSRTSCETASTICTKTTRAERRAQRETAKIWRCPETPKPSLLHLSVTAQSRGILDYITHFSEQFNEQHRCPSSVKPQETQASTSSTTPPNGPEAFTHNHEREITEHVLTSLFREILDSSAFTQSLITLASKPSTYPLHQTFPSHCPSFQSSIPTPPYPTSSHDEDQPQDLLSGMDGEKGEHQFKADCQEPGVFLKIRQQKQKLPHAEHLPADMSEEVLLNIIQNLMMEADGGELTLTAHPCTANLPLFSARLKMEPKAMKQEEKGD